MRIVSILSFGFIFPVPAFACAVCFGAASSPTIALALRWAVFLLLGILLLLFWGIVSFFVRMQKRSGHTAPMGGLKGI